MNSCLLILCVFIGHTKTSRRIMFNLAWMYLLVSIQFLSYMIYLFTAIGLTPSGSSTLHIYTKSIHRTTHWNRIHDITYITIRIHKHNNKNI
jgi:hypothetical protein